jgi:hypothetical protein
MPSCPHGTLCRRNPRHWTGKSPQAARKSTVLGAMPPSRTMSNTNLVNAITFIQIFELRRRHHERQQEGRCVEAPKSRKHTVDGRPAPSLQQRTQNREDDLHPQKLLRRRHPLQNAAGKHPATTYTMYTPGSTDSPPSRRRSGCRRRGIR